MPVGPHTPSQRHCDRARSGRDAIHHAQRGLPRPSGVIKRWIAARRAAARNDGKRVAVKSSPLKEGVVVKSPPLKKRVTIKFSPLKRGGHLDACWPPYPLPASLRPRAKRAGRNPSRATWSDAPLRRHQTLDCRAPQTSSSAGLPRGVPPLAMTEKGWVSADCFILATSK